MQDMETFLAGLKGEIDIRSDYVEKLKTRASKIYLLLRNLGTVSTFIGVVLFYLGYSQRILSTILYLILCAIWVNDFLDYSMVILLESQFVSELKEMLVKVSLTSKFTKIEDLQEYITQQMMTLSDKREGLSFVSASDSLRRGTMLMKKNV